MDLKKIIDKFYRLKVKFNLLDKRRTNLAIYETMSAFLTDRILQGETNYRGELDKMQRLIEEDKKLIKFLKKVKS